MYIKTMQNGNPLFYPYKILPFTTPENQAASQREDNESTDKFSEQLKKCYERIEKLEEQFSSIKKKKESDWEV